jgi:hypothetical protein
VQEEAHSSDREVLVLRTIGAAPFSKYTAYSSFYTAHTIVSMSEYVDIKKSYTGLNKLDHGQVCLQCCSIRTTTIIYLTLTIVLTLSQEAALN